MSKRKTTYIKFDYSPGDDHDAVCKNGEIESVRMPLSMLPNHEIAHTSLQGVNPGVRFHLQRVSVPGYTSSADSLPTAELSFALREGDSEIAAAFVSDTDTEAYHQFAAVTRKEISRKVKDFVNDYCAECDARELLHAPHLVMAALRYGDNRSVMIGSINLLMADSGAPMPMITSASATATKLVTDISLLNHPCRLSVSFDSGIAVADCGATHIDILLSKGAPTYHIEDELRGIVRLSSSAPLYSEREERYNLVPSRCRCWDIGAYSASEIDRHVLSLHDYRVVASIDISDVINSDCDDRFAVVPLRAECSSKFAETSPDSYIRAPFYQKDVIDGVLFGSGGLSHLVSPEFRLPLPSRWETLPEAVGVAVEVRKNGMIIQAGEDRGLADATDIQPVNMAITSMIPRFFFYPDTDAMYLIIRSAYGSAIRLPLTKCEDSGGAYFYAGIESGNVESETVYLNSQTFQSASYIEEQRVFSGYVSSPPFPFKSIIMPGKVYGITEISRTVTGGEPGQSPVYCITSAGVFICKIENGSPVPVQRLTPAVPINAGAWNVINGGVRIYSADGVVTIKGSSVDIMPVIYEEREDIEVVTRPLKLSGKEIGLKLEPAIGRGGVRLSLESSADLHHWHTQIRVAESAIRGYHLPSAPYKRLRIRIPAGAELPRRLCLIF